MAGFVQGWHLLLIACIRSEYILPSVGLEHKIDHKLWPVFFFLSAIHIDFIYLGIL